MQVEEEGKRQRKREKAGKARERAEGEAAYQAQARAQQEAVERRVQQEVEEQKQQQAELKKVRSRLRKACKGLTTVTAEEVELIVSGTELEPLRALLQHAPRAGGAEKDFTEHWRGELTRRGRVLEDSRAEAKLESRLAKEELATHKSKVCLCSHTHTHTHTHAYTHIHTRTYTGLE
jgi:hypothetical protein